MHRPEFVTSEDITRWSEIIDKDSNIPQFVRESAIMREMMYAGLWMGEELLKLKCNPVLIGRIQFTTGSLCFGKPDPWEVHQEVLQAYQNNELEFEMDYSEDDSAESQLN